MAKYSELKKTLKSHDLRITDCRMNILEHFLANGKALSIENLEDQVGDYDKVTLYRTLSSFTEHGLLHKIPDDSGMVSYGVCHDTCDTREHRHDHIHFKCRSWGESNVLMNIPRKLPSRDTRFRKLA